MLLMVWNNMESLTSYKTLWKAVWGRSNIAPSEQCRMEDCDAWGTLTGTVTDEDVPGVLTMSLECLPCSSRAVRTMAPMFEVWLGIKAKMPLWKRSEKTVRVPHCRRINVAGFRHHRTLRHGTTTLCESAGIYHRYYRNMHLRALILVTVVF